MLPEMRDGKSPYLKQKKFSEHYALDYFEHSRRLWRHKGWLLGGPLALCVLWLLVESGRGNWRTFQAGPVSSVCKHGTASHASFRNECSRCHMPTNYVDNVMLSGRNQLRHERMGLPRQSDPLLLSELP